VPFVYSSSFSSVSSYFYSSFFLLLDYFLEAVDFFSEFFFGVTSVTGLTLL